MDELEREMHDGAPVRFREKVVAKGPGLAVVAIGAALALGGIGQGLALGDALAGSLVAGAGLILGGLLAALGVAGTAARTVVTDRAIHLQAGIRFREIPRDAVRSVEVGVRRAAYRARYDLSILPIGTPVVAIHFDEGGEAQGVIVSSEDPEALVLAIGCAPRVRVAPDPEDAEDGPLEDEAGLAAEAEAEVEAALAGSAAADRAPDERA